MLNKEILILGFKSGKSKFKEGGYTTVQFEMDGARRGYLFSRVVSIENLRRAHQNARKGKKHYQEVQMVDADPDRHLEQIRTALINKTFSTSPYEKMSPDAVLGSVGAYHGWLKHCDSYNLARTYLYDNPSLRTAVEHAAETGGTSCPKWLEVQSHPKTSRSTS